MTICAIMRRSCSPDQAQVQGVAGQEDRHALIAQRGVVERLTVVMAQLHQHVQRRHRAPLARLPGRPQRRTPWPVLWRMPASLKTGTALSAGLASALAALQAAEMAQIVAPKPQQLGEAEESARRAWGQCVSSGRNAVAVHGGHLA